MQDPIFSLTCLWGMIKEGKLLARWTARAVSATNSVLLWPEVLEHVAQGVAARHGPAALKGAGWEWLAGKTR